MTNVLDRKLLFAINDQHRTATLREFGSPDAAVTVLYFHRFGGGSLEFSKPAAKLVQAGCHVCCLEYFGHEASEWLGPDEYVPANDVACAQAVLREYSEKPLLVIGNGWGGHIALCALEQDTPNLMGVFLFDYVNKIQFSTDIVMPLEHSICGITAPTIEEFQQEVETLTRPYGRFGKFITAMSIRRARKIGDILRIPIDASAYRPFTSSPDRKYSAGAQLLSITKPVGIINGRLAEFKNLIHPPKSGARIPRTIRSYSLPKFSFLSWDSTNAIDRIIEFLKPATSTTENGHE